LTPATPRKVAGKRRRWWKAIAGVVVALLGALCADMASDIIKAPLSRVTTSLLRSQSRAWSLCVFFLVIVALVGFPMMLVVRCIRRVAVIRLFAARDQQRAVLDAPYYTETMPKDCRRLRMTVRGIARAVGIPRFVVRYFTSHPDVIPRPDILEELEKTFLLPPGSFRRQIPYGAEMTRARLLRYQKLGICVWTISKICESSNQSRAAMLARIQRQLDEET